MTDFMVHLPLISFTELSIASSDREYPLPEKGTTSATPLFYFAPLPERVEGSHVLFPEKGGCKDHPDGCDPAREVSKTTMSVWKRGLLGGCSLIETYLGLV